MNYISIYNMLYIFFWYIIYLLLTYIIYIGKIPVLTDPCQNIIYKIDNHNLFVVAKVLYDYKCTSKMFFLGGGLIF